MDKQIQKISDLLQEYSLGNFSRRLPISSRRDAWDAVRAGINMLGEELKATTISRDYFNSIFHSVSDMVFILDRAGTIRDRNGSVEQQLGYGPQQLEGRPLDHLLLAGYPPLLRPMARSLQKTAPTYRQETFFRALDGTAVPVAVQASPLYDQGRRKKGFIVLVKDRRAQVQTENLIIRTIIDTQEKERQRLAKDLHDSLGQQLAAIQFYISAAAAGSRVGGQKDLLLKSSQALSRVQADMRRICFALMPQTLEAFGLVKAVAELCRQLQQPQGARFHFRHDPGFPPLSHTLEIDLYRVIQEFIANALQHGRAGDISIELTRESDEVVLLLRDNGQGFDTHLKRDSGMGLQNARSRVQSHNGILEITSRPGKGTHFLVVIPNKNAEHDRTS